MKTLSIEDAELRNAVKTGIYSISLRTVFTSSLLGFGIFFGLRVREKSDISEKNHSVGVSDVCKLAMQIKDILPDVSFETIKYHINSSSTLDIDTVLASILDADSQESSLLRSQSSPVTVTSSPKPVISSSKASVFESKKPNKYKTYEERKFDLINEARKRYLSRENNKIEKAKA
ncbi:unnamed protein product [Brachionus calyciflorus]|uniref:CUE domain-containing protein n=1 Tax=Brachionus calyciflorus TaxID=104777 RepID=A0A813UG17_9BILA|nr:unnamed protein product [Brachionus calyciflorus]